MKQISRLLVLTAIISVSSFSSNAQLTFPDYPSGISIKSEDGSTVMNFGFRVQSLYMATLNDINTVSSLNQNMLIRRSRLKSDGHFLSKKFRYKFEMGMSNRDIGNGKEEAQSGFAPRLILDAVFKYTPNKHWQFWFGQTKLPGNRERVISSQSLQFVDRSLVNSEFNIDRDFGVWIVHANQIFDMPLYITGAISRGEGRNVTTNNTGGLSYTSRVEILPLGDFINKGHYFSADLEREPKPKLAIGASYNYNDGASRTGGQLGNFVTDSNGLYLANLNNLMIDFMFKYKGFSALGEYAKRSSSTNFQSALPLSTYFDLGSGYSLQAGYLLKNNYEVAVRWTDIHAQKEFTATQSQTQYTLCLSKYISGHNLKVQSDISYTHFNQTEREGLMYRFQVEFGI